MRSPYTISPHLMLANAVAVWIFVSCKEPFTPPVTRDANSILVVNGQIISGNDSTIITLSRTRSLTDSVAFYPELHAQVELVPASGSPIPFFDFGNGTYGQPSLALDATRQYTLQVRTADGKEFATDPMRVIQTPPIDSISWNQDTTGGDNKRGITIYATTHDPNNQTKYYQWKYEETWEYHAGWESFFLLLLPSYQVVPRNQDQFTYICYRNFNSTSLRLATSENLAEDVIYKSPLVFIPQGDEKLGVRYRILVKQFALSQEAYGYWQLLKKNTELTGSIFDPQPSQQTGNVHCISNPGESVLGYVSASTIQTQAIFVKNIETEHWGYFTPGLCPLTGGNYNDEFFRAMGLRPVQQLNGDIYSSTFPSCIDCTASGGSTIKPAFW